MSKINKIRIVNLNYNNNTMRVDDELFYLDSEDTMFSLRNGGGKSVLVQMIMAPFVNKKYRNLKDRSFESYFTTSTPTYILVEWKLDNGGGYVLTGMMVRKKDSISDEDSKDKLDIINFIHEYRNRNPYDIENIPVVEKANGRKKVKTFVNSKTLFEDLKKDKKYDFNYYDMTNYSTSGAYFNKLLIYDINHKEWEDIIRKINLKESGLSDLFANAKNVEGLVKEWFIPSIEKKICKEENRIKKYEEIINKHIKDYKNNKSKIDSKGKMELFNNIAEEIKVTIKETIDDMESREALENEIANIIVYLHKKLKGKLLQKENLEEEINKLKEELKDLDYEEKSLEIYEAEETYIKAKEKYEESKNNEEEGNRRIKELEKKVNIYTCAKIYEEYTQCSEKLQALEIERKLIEKKNEDTAPRIENLGFTIKNIVENEKRDLEEKEQERSNRINSLRDEKLNKQRELKNNRITLKDLNRKEGNLEGSLKSFNSVEVNFNKRYSENIQRNIEGLLEEGLLLNLEEEINNNILKLKNNEKSFGEDLFNAKEREKILKSNRENNKENLTRAEYKLKDEEHIFNEAKKELDERKEILKYVDLNEDSIFDTDKILCKFSDKIFLLNDKERAIKNKKESIENEIFKLETGKVLELPKELQEELKKRDITITYGMEWLKKNGMSESENLEITRKNPFIPYALIMDSREIEILKKQPLDIFTSTPIAIVKRDSITEEVINKEKNIINIHNVEFLISFNHKLLNEEELKALIQKKNISLEEIKEELMNLEQDIKLYRDKESIIKTSKLDKNKYEEIEDNIEKLKKEIKTLRENEITISKDISEVQEEISNLNINMDKTKESLRTIENKLRDFKELSESYEEYKKNKNSLEETKETIKITEGNISYLEGELSKIDRETDECKEILNTYKYEKEKIQEQLSNYYMYEKGEFIKKDKEDLIAEFCALNKEISSTEKELNEKIAEFNKKYNESTTALKTKGELYNLREEDYTKVKYNLYEEQEVEKELRREEKFLKEIENESRDLDRKVVRIQSEIENMKKLFKKKFNTDDLKPRKLIFKKNYDEEKAKVDIKINNNEEEKSKVSNIIFEIDKNIDNLKEYKDFKLNEELQIELDVNSLSDHIGRKRRDLRNLDKKNSENINRIQREIDNKLRQNSNFNDDEKFKQTIDVFIGLVEKPRGLLRQIETIQITYSNLINKLLQDIAILGEEEDKILSSLLEYINDINENLSEIDNNSTINIGGKSLKMLNIIVPKWDENKEVYKIKLRDYVQTLRDESLLRLDKNENIEELISKRITSDKLYNEIVGIGNVKVKLYKVEEERQRQISWDEVSTNSGGEGFLSAFIILSSLLTYIRKDIADMFIKNESGKVLIMDNPFAQTSSSHLLKPLMDIAKKSNTQLICFTGLGGESIHNRFNNIYVLNTIQSRLKGGTQYLRGEHKKGQDHENEGEYEIIEASRTKIEEQMRLF